MLFGRRNPTLLTPDELRSTLFAILDIRTHTRRIVQLLEDADGGEEEEEGGVDDA